MEKGANEKRAAIAAQISKNISGNLLQKH